MVALELAQRKQMISKRTKKILSQSSDIGHRARRGPESVIPPDREDFPSSLLSPPLLSMSSFLPPRVRRFLVEAHTKNEEREERGSPRRRRSR